MKIVILLKPYVTLRYLVLCFLVVSKVTGFYPFETIVKAQDQTERLEGKIDLNNCLKYAFKHQPLIQQLQLRDEINRRNVDLALSDWLPQVDFTAGYQHYLKQPVSIFPDFTNPEGPKREVTTGVTNTSSLQLNANQVIYNPEVLTAGRSAKFYRRQSQQSNHQSMINLVVGVSKAFYDVLLSQAKLDFYQEDLARTDKTLKDAHSMYESGLSDKIDYQRAEISMNNIKAEILGTQEEIKAKYALLKELMGYPAGSPIDIAIGQYIHGSGCFTGYEPGNTVQEPDRISAAAHQPVPSKVGCELLQTWNSCHLSQHMPTIIWFTRTTR